MIPLAVVQPEQTFFQDRVLPVPERQREAQSLPVIRNTGQAVFAPTVGPGAGLIMGEVIPGVSAFAVVLPYRSLLPLAEVGPPLLPGNFLVPSLVESDVFSGHWALSFYSERKQ